MDDGRVATPGGVPVVVSDQEEEYLFEEYVEQGDPLIYLLDGEEAYGVKYWMDPSDAVLVNEAVTEIQRIITEHTATQITNIDGSEEEEEAATAGDDRGCITGLEFEQAAGIADAIQPIIQNPKNVFQPKRSQ